MRGLGTTIALPMLDAMVPSLKALAAGAGAAAKAFPNRMAFVYIPNGVIMEHWTPEAVGAKFQLPATLEPLKPVQKDFMVISGLAHDKARSNGDGAGDHARANATFLTGCQARKTAGADIRIGVSVDQIAAAVAGRRTRLPSLELSCDRGRQTGSCDSGYSCAYQFNFSWKTASTPMPPETDPRQVFERLFGNGNKSEAEESQSHRERYQKSILDFALEDANRLKASLGATDRRKLDEYLAAIREMEQRIEQAEKFAATLPDFDKPTGVPAEFAQHVRLMYDLMALGFQTDTTRIATFLMAHDGSNRSYPELGVPDGHHNLSHHGNDPEKKEKIAKINRFHVEQFAYFLKKLKATPEGGGTLLDHCMIVYGGGISDGNRHRHDELPILLAGRGGGTIKPGRHLKLNDRLPMTNLYLSMLERMGVAAERVGDSTGKLPGLS